MPGCSSLQARLAMEDEKDLLTDYCGIFAVMLMGENPVHLLDQDEVWFNR